MEPILEQILQSPKLVLYSQHIQDVISEEQQRRRQFYEDITDEKAEFINGEVIIHSPVRIEHNIAGKLLLRFLDIYVQINRLGFVGHEKMMITLTRNDYEPDICFWTRKKSDKFKPRQTLFPAPDFIAEILSPSTEQRDRNIKWEDYAAHGVSEYWIIDTEARSVEQHVLKKDGYHLHAKKDSGILKFKAVRRCEIPVRALFDEDENLAALKLIVENSK